MTEPGWLEGSHHPFENPEATQPAGIGKGLGLSDPAASPQSREVTDMSPLGPDGPALGHQRLDPVVGQEIRLKTQDSGRGLELIKCDFRRDVLEPAGLGWVEPALLVAIRPQPFRHGSVSQFTCGVDRIVKGNEPATAKEIQGFT